MQPEFEPYRARVVEPIPMSTPAEREVWIRDAGYNPFLLRSEQVLIDLVTDSGVSALSVAQWSAMHGSDESFSGSRSFHHFVEAARDLFGHRHVIPCHQGRAAEQLLCGSVIRPGQTVLANTLFATTRANIEAVGGRGLDLPVAAAADPSDPHPFKGSIDLDRLEANIGELGAEGIAFVVLTVTDNSGGGQPVSLANLRAAAELCRATGVPLLLDAARVAENAYLIRLREAGQADRTPRDIAREMFSLADGVFMSTKKDGLSNCGGVVSLNDDAWAEAVRVRLLMTEGVPTAGGLAGRDLEGMRVALEEMLDEDHLAWRVATVHRLGAELDAVGVPVVQPLGGHAVYVDGRACCPHLPDEQLPAWSLSVAYYVASGVRTWETGNVMAGRPDPDTGSWQWPALDLMRLAVPRRVYTRSHLDYAARSLVDVVRSSDRITGLRFAYRPPMLAQFVATFEPAG
jgi:tryptophanase